MIEWSIPTSNDLAEDALQSALAEAAKCKALVDAAREAWHWANSTHSGYAPDAAQQIYEAAMWQRLGTALAALSAKEAL